MGSTQSRSNQNSISSSCAQKNPNKGIFFFLEFLFVFLCLSFPIQWCANLFNTRNLRPGLISVGRFLLKSMFLFKFSLFAFCHNFLHSDVTFPKAYLTLNDIANVHHCSGAHLHKYFFKIFLVYFLSCFYYISNVFLLHFQKYIETLHWVTTVHICTKENLHPVSEKKMPLCWFLLLKRIDVDHKVSIHH